MTEQQQQQQGVQRYANGQVEYDSRTLSDPGLHVAVLSLFLSDGVGKIYFRPWCV